MSLREVLDRDEEARAFYRELHPSVKEVVDAQSSRIALREDLVSVANNAMTQNLRALGGIFDDGETWPD